MSEGIVINIPIKPYLKKYLLRKLQISDNIIPISTNDIICFGIYIINIISKKRDYLLMSNKNNIKNFIQTINWNNTVTILLNDSYCKTSGLFINEEKIFFINKFLEKQFRNELSVFLHANSLYNAKFVMEYGMDDFLAHYHITEDDIKKETLVTFFHRNKNIYSYIR